MWRAHYLLGGLMEHSDPPQALTSFKEFRKLASPDNALNPVVKQAIAKLEQAETD